MNVWEEFCCGGSDSRTNSMISSIGVLGHMTTERSHIMLAQNASLNVNTWPWLSVPMPTPKAIRMEMAYLLCGRVGISTRWYVVAPPPVKLRHLLYLRQRMLLCLATFEGRRLRSSLGRPPRWGFYLRDVSWLSPYSTVIFVSTPFSFFAFRTSRWNIV